MFQTHEFHASGRVQKRDSAQSPNFRNSLSEFGLASARLIWLPNCRLHICAFACYPWCSKEDHVMTGSAQYASQRVIVCCICGGPVPLETSKTDERGKAVHEECYVRKTISRFRTVRRLMARSKFDEGSILRLGPKSTLGRVITD